MLDATAKKLVRLLQPGQPTEMRAAAALMLGETGVKDAEIAQAVCEAVRDGDPTLRTRAMTAAGKLRVESALPLLVPRMQAGGDEAEIAAQAAARLGTKGMKAVREVIAQAPPGLKRRLTAALASSGTADAETAALDALLDKDAGVVDAAARSLLAEVPSFSAARRKALADRVLEQLADKSLAAASQTALVRLLSALGDPRGEAFFWARIVPPHPRELRAAALQAIGTRPLPSGKDVLKRLLLCAADPDFRVAAPALMMLKTVPVADRGGKDWLPLFDAPEAAARRFVIEKLDEKDTPEIAEALVKQLGHRDRALRDAALSALAKKKYGRAALADALLNAQSPDAAWDLARAQMPHAAEYSPELRGRVEKQAFSYLEAGDRRADALLALLREADARAMRDRLEERALALRKKKDYEKALIYYRQVTRDPACAEEVRFDAAACALKRSERELTAETRAADPALTQFARLVHSHETEPAERLQETKWLDPEELFYLGFHFVEGADRRDREFGDAVLQLVIERAPKTKTARDARSKLRSLGLD